MWQKNDALLNMMCITYITLSIRRAMHDMHDTQSVHAASMQWPVLAADVPAGGITRRRLPRNAVDCSNCR